MSEDAIIRIVLLAIGGACALMGTPGVQAMGVVIVGIIAMDTAL